MSEIIKINIFSLDKNYKIIVVVYMNMFAQNDKLMKLSSIIQTLEENIKCDQNCCTRHENLFKKCKEPVYQCLQEEIKNNIIKLKDTQNEYFKLQTELLTKYNNECGSHDISYGC